MASKLNGYACASVWQKAPTSDQCLFLLTALGSLLGGPTPIAWTSPSLENILGVGLGANRGREHASGASTGDLG